MRSHKVLAPAGVAALAIALASGIGLSNTGALAQPVPGPAQPSPPLGPLTPPPPPEPNATLTPISVPSPPAGSPTPAPRGRRRPAAPASSSEPSPTPTPTSPAFATLDGTWEVQVQYRDHTLYSYLKIAQSQTTLSGTWNTNGKAYPLDGSYDGRLIRIVVKEPAGNVVFSGYVEGATDMVGLADFGKGNTPAFTAEHRALPPKNILKRY